jgi:hypothetical protein
MPNFAVACLPAHETGSARELACQIEGRVGDECRPRLGNFSRYPMKHVSEKFRGAGNQYALKSISSPGFVAWGRRRLILVVDVRANLVLGRVMSIQPIGD